MCSGPDIPEPPKRPVKAPANKRKKAPVVGKQNKQDSKRKKKGARRLTIALGGESSGGTGRSGVGIPK